MPSAVLLKPGPYPLRQYAHHASEELPQWAQIAFKGTEKSRAPEQCSYVEFERTLDNFRFLGM